MKLRTGSMAIATLVATCLVASAPQLLAEQFIGYVDNTFNPGSMVRIPGSDWILASSDATPGKPSQESLQH